MKKAGNAFQNLEINIPSRFKKYSLPVLLVLVLAVFAGQRAGVGKFTHVVPIYILLAVPVLAGMDQGWLFFIFQVLPFLCLFQVPALHLPLAIPPVVVGLCGLVVVQMLFQQKRSHLSLASLLEYLPLFILSVGGLVTALLSSELFRWFYFPFALILWLFLSKALLRNQKDALRMIRSILAAILAYCLIIWIMKSVGHVETIKSAFADWRLFGNGEILSLGPIVYTLFSIELGSIAGFGVLITIFLLFLPKGSNFSRAIYIASLLLFIAILALTAARGATIAAVIGAILLIFLGRRNNVKGIIFLSVFGLLILVFQNTFFELVPSGTLLRFQDLQNNLTQVSTFQYRIHLLTLTIKEFHLHPWGAGYHYLWDKYRLDESIIYSSILNGTGMIGTLGFVIWMVQLLVRFLSGLTDSRKQYLGNFPALGLAVWLFVCLNGLSSSSILLDPITSFLIWGMLITIYQATRLLYPSKPQKFKEPIHAS